MTQTEILKATFTYEGNYIQPRCRTSTYSRFRDQTLVQVRRLDERGCPLVVELDEAGPSSSTVPMRWDGEALYRPMYSPDGIALSLDRFKVLLEGDDPELSRPWADYPFPHKVDRHTRGDGSGRSHEIIFDTKTVEGIGGRAHDQSKRADAEMKTVRAALEVLVIGDMVHRRAAEPYWQFDFAAHRKNLRLRRDTIDPKTVLGTQVFARLDRGDQLLGIVERNGYAVTPDGDFSHPDAVRIHRPDLLRFDDRMTNARHMLREFRIKMHDALLYVGDTDIIRLWADLTDLNRRFQAGDTSVVDQAYDVLSRMAAVGFDAPGGNTFHQVPAKAVAARLDLFAATPATGPVPTFVADEDAEAIQASAFTF